jgi:hypothetical protein
MRQGITADGTLHTLSISQSVWEFNTQAEDKEVTI